MIFGKSQLIKRYEDEIDYLRKENQDLKDRLLSLISEAYWSFKETTKEPMPVPSFVNPMGMLQSMEAKTPEEVNDKKMAEEQIKQMFGAH